MPLPELGRRQTLALGAAALLPARGWAATAARLVLATREDALDGAIGEVWGAPFTRLTGTALAFDGFDPSRVADMVDDDTTSWDVCLDGPAVCNTLGRAGLLEMLDFQVIDRRAAPSGFVIPWWGVPAFLVSAVLACDTAAFGGRRPRRWADFWDVATYPGQRAMPADSVVGVCESALLADGVAPDRLYPLDLDRAFAGLAALKPRLVFYPPGGAGALLSGGGAVMALVRNTTALALRRASGGRIDWSWDGAVLSPCLWMVPKGNPAGAGQAMRFIASTQLPERQIALLQRTGCGPANPDARKMLSPALAALDPGSPAALAAGVQTDQSWYNANGAQLRERWQRFVTT